MLHQLNIKKRLDGLISWVTANENNASIPDSEKYLKRVFGNTEYDGFNFYEQAKKIILRTSKSPRKLETRLQFDPDRATLPTIHVTLPADTLGKEDALGVNTGEVTYENADDTYNVGYGRSFTTSYDLIITSNNPNETELLYNLTLSLLISGADTLNQDYDNFRFSGREVQMKNDLVPDRIFTRTVSLSVDFKRFTPSIGNLNTYINNIYLSSGGTLPAAADEQIDTFVTSYLVKDILDSFIVWVTENQNSTATPNNEKYLSRIFGNEIYDGYDFSSQAKNIILRTSKNPRKLETRIQFDAQRSVLPTIHITMPSDNVGVKDALGINVSEEIYTDDANNTFNYQYSRNFTAEYNLVISSSNANEVELLYELVMHLFIAGADTIFSYLFDGFRFKGREVQMNNQLIPDRIYTRVVSISFDYSKIVPSIGYYGQFTNKVFAVSEKGGFLRINYPREGDTFFGGDVIQVAWKYRGNFETVKVEFFDGTSWIVLAAETPNDNFYSYTLPNINAGSAKFKVSKVDGDLEIFDESGNFKITQI